MSSDETSLPSTVEEAHRVLGLDPRADADASAVKRAARERFVEAHPDVPSGSRARFMAVMRARSMLLSAIDGGANVGGSSVRASAAETAARRARENALPKHVRAFSRHGRGAGGRRARAERGRGEEEGEEPDRPRGTRSAESPIG